MQNTTKILVIVLVVLLAVVLLGSVGMMGFGGFGMGSGMMNGRGMMDGYGYGHNPLSAIFSLASWALILGGVALLVVYLVRNAKGTGASSESPLEILKSRYAHGEITKEQFDAIRADLGSAK